MSPKAFHTTVLGKKPPSVSEKSLSEAIDFHVEQGRMSQGNVAECIQLAGRFERYKAATGEHTGSESRLLPPLTPGTLVISKHHVTKIRPGVEQFRQECFGYPQPPFASYDDAVAWIEETAQHQEIGPAEERQ